MKVGKGVRLADARNEGAEDSEDSEDVEDGEDGEDSNGDSEEASNT